MKKTNEICSNVNYLTMQKRYIKNILKIMLELLDIEYTDSNNSEIKIPENKIVIKILDENEINDNDFINKNVNYLVVTTNKNFILYDNKNNQKAYNTEIGIYYCCDCGCVNFISDNVRQKCVKNGKYCLYYTKFADIKGFCSFIATKLYLRVSSIRF